MKKAIGIDSPEHQIVLKTYEDLKAALISPETATQRLIEVGIKNGASTVEIWGRSNRRTPSEDQ